MIIKVIKKIARSIPMVVTLYGYFLKFKTGQSRGFRLHSKFFSNLTVLEIGGPSQIFESKGAFPLYGIVASVDNSNYSNSTFWSSINEGYNFKYGKNEVGYQFVQDATEMGRVESEKYGMVISSHVIEHIANPIKALNEWKRIVRINGYLVLIVPHKDGTYDRNRPITTLRHIIGDFTNGTTEDDETHFQEVLDMHDLTVDTTVSNYDSHRERTLNNSSTRIVHHHVFNSLLVAQILNELKFKIEYIEALFPYHIIAIAQRLPIDTELTVDNSSWLSYNNPSYLRSRFKSDKT